MNYGLYLSAAGVMASSYRQDVIANNLANSETSGFKRDLALFHERRTAAREQGLGPDESNPTLENLTGGTFANPTLIDQTQGDLEPSSDKYDVAIQGAGAYFMVDDHGTPRLTRNGQFSVDSTGRLVLASDPTTPVLGADRKPIAVDNRLVFNVGADGTIVQGKQPVGRIGVFDAPDPSRLTKHGGTLLDYPQADKLQLSSTVQVRGGFVERSNVDPAVELSQLMNAQRELEANANMIRYQDQTLSRLVNDVAKVG